MQLYLLGKVIANKLFPNTITNRITDRVYMLSERSSVLVS